MWSCHNLKALPDKQIHLILMKCPGFLLPFFVIQRQVKDMIYD